MQNNISNNIIGWCNSDEDVILCKDCFEKSYKDNDVKWSPVRREEGKDNSYICDECGKKL